jgi:hypothetical protein
MKSLQILIIIFFLFIITPSIAAEYYTWEDESGNIVITNTPPPENVKKYNRNIEEESDQTAAQTETAAEQKSVDPPPPLVFAAPPEVVVVPSGDRYIYMVPNMSGIYFYHGYWYRFHHHHWFRSAIYNGNWVLSDTSLIPHAIVRIPPEYPHYMPPGYQRINYGNLHKDWRNWDNTRHWHSFEWYKNELRPETRKERLRGVEAARTRDGYTGGNKPTASLDSSQKVKNKQKKKSGDDAQSIKPPKEKHKKTRDGINEQKKDTSPEKHENKEKLGKPKTH